ncbi:hypothetical protein GCM10011375_12910 [Hymenobacter qilianensis]|uniref:Uncharacterized protein n=2 Tax=Hymenobacter qilianensis TaxID=1385715 RepID=A0ACB5PPF7_9BACT|nr:DUF2007 domain-containing protein [Hymenobacter qilianensis]QNP53166.1 DUF2007 domain-containing protein [Hymenobacter qilianensis]GGF59147.1 hypothetical protein GCM10011375_12910 [Hymenobacter qilianensis]
MFIESTDGTVVLLESFANSISAHLAKNQLETAGIACFISNENRPYGPISGGVRLHVRQQDLEAAQQILSEHSALMTAVQDDDLDTTQATSDSSGSLLTRLRAWLLS